MMAIIRKMSTDPSYDHHNERERGREGAERAEGAEGESGRLSLLLSQLG